MSKPGECHDLCCIGCGSSLNDQCLDPDCAFSIDHIHPEGVLCGPCTEEQQEKVYIFPVVLRGRGTTPEEAWIDATDAFDLDQGPCPDTYEEVSNE